MERLTDPRLIRPIARYRFNPSPSTFAEFIDMPTASIGYHLVALSDVDSTQVNVVRHGSAVRALGATKPALSVARKVQLRRENYLALQLDHRGFA